ncbi:MAG: hypothetical protein IT380_00605 [Myxococcales bacterium]|nr:hypothetical protein [Myxococcales bacterium]
MAERVDKGWQARGIEAYSTEAILGTLSHYGVALDEAGFKELAAQDFPLAIAQLWHQRWKGTGQFSRFPAAAAEELWRRLCGGAVAPTDLTLALIRLLGALNAAMEGKPDDGTRDTRFKVVEAFLEKLPGAELRRDRFIAEMTAALGDELGEAVDHLAEALARRGQPELAERFVAIEEKLFPVRAGSARAMVKAAAGDAEGAAKELTALAQDGSRDAFARLSALDGLIELDRLEVAKAVALELVERAEEERDLELGTQVVYRLTRLLKADPNSRDREALRKRVEALAAALGPGGE